MGITARWKRKTGPLKQELHAIYLACKDPRTPWYAKILAVCVVGYAFSPIDLIPDPIPIIGYLDDFLLIPLGIYFVKKMIPPEVLAECRERAKNARQRKGKNWVGAIIIITAWVLLAVLAIFLIKRYLF
jgi:uncharacterized membrane protein YkvA (DUF1232 family)